MIQAIKELIRKLFKKINPPKPGDFDHESSWKDLDDGTHMWLGSS